VSGRTDDSRFGSNDCESTKVTMARLSMVSPELAARLQSTVEERALRRAARAAAAVVVERAGLVDDRVDRAIEILSAGATDPEVRKVLEGYSEGLDERAWDLMDARSDDRGSEEEYLVAFGRARAASAAVWALEADPVMAALEATYEAHCAFSDGSGVLTAVAAALEGD